MNNLLDPNLLDDMQEAAIDFAYERDESLLVVPVGGGKTVISLTVIDELRVHERLGRFLVIAPLNVCRETWQHEHTKWSHLAHLNVAFATGAPAKRAKIIEGDADVVVINCENVPWFFKNYGHYHGFDGLIIDELTKFKDASGKGFKSLRVHRKSFDWFCGLTATPVEEQLTDLYAIQMLVDGGAALGTRRDAFLRRYFYPLDFEERQWAHFDWTPEKLVKLIEGTTFAPPTEAYEAGLPALDDEIVAFDMPTGLRDVYHQMAKDMVIGEVEAVNAAVLSGKLRQIANGFLYDNEDVVEFTTAKMGAFIDLVKQAEGAALVTYEFDWQLEMIERGLTRYRVALLGRDKNAVERFNAGELDYLILHPKSGGHGLNLQYGGFEIFMVSPIWSSDQRSQLIGRLRRRGQPSDVVRVRTLVSDGTVESNEMLMRVSDKKERAALFMNHLREVANRA